MNSEERKRGGVSLNFPITTRCKMLTLSTILSAIVIGLETFLSYYVGLVRYQLYLLYSVVFMTVSPLLNDE